MFLGIINNYLVVAFISQVFETVHSGTINYRDLFIILYCAGKSLITKGRLRGLTGSAVEHGSIAAGFKPRPRYVRRMFHLSLRSITFEGFAAHLAYLVHNSGRKTGTFTP